MASYLILSAISNDEFIPSIRGSVACQKQKNKWERSQGR
jgi:hypothetical protein